MPAGEGKGGEAREVVFNKRPGGRTPALRKRVAPPSQAQRGRGVTLGKYGRRARRARSAPAPRASPLMAIFRAGYGPHSETYVEEFR